MIFTLSWYVCILLGGISVLDFPPLYFFSTLNLSCMAALSRSVFVVECIVLGHGLVARQ